MGQDSLVRPEFSQEMEGVKVFSHSCESQLFGILRKHL